MCSQDGITCSYCIFLYRPQRLVVLKQHLTSTRMASTLATSEVHSHPHSSHLMITHSSHPHMLVMPITPHTACTYSHHCHTPTHVPLHKIIPISHFISLVPHSHSACTQDEVLVSSDNTGGVKYITLNRPKALNSLNFNMTKIITREMKVLTL